jgi:NH3-dependent NAD+ synthetase
MAKSNTDGHLLLSTGNKTELAVGYSTIYGDAAGGYAPIKDVEKTLVWDLARYRNELAVQNKQTPIQTQKQTNKGLATTNRIIRQEKSVMEQKQCRRET